MLALLLSSLTAIAAPQLPRVTDPASALQRLAAEAAPAVRTLSRDVDAFHYMPADPRRYGYAQPESDWAVAQINNGVRNSFWTNAQPRLASQPGMSDWFGGGVYVATDPITSRRHGAPPIAGWGGFPGDQANHPWWLFVITLPEDSKFLDITLPRGIHTAVPTSLSRELQQGLLTHYGCRATNVFEIFQVVVPEDLRCVPVRRWLLQRFNIAAILYSYYNTPQLAGRPLCRGLRQAAFMLTRQQAFTSAQVRVFSKVLPGREDSGSELRSLVQGVWQYAGLDNGFDWSGQHYTPLWPGLRERADRDDVEEYLEDRIFGCGDHGEDRRNLADRPITP